MADAKFTGYKAIEEIPEPLLRNLRRATTKEEYIQNVLQPLRQMGTNHAHLEEKNITALTKKALARAIAQQVSAILQMDLNLDGKVTSEEIETSLDATQNGERVLRRKEQFRQYDQNGDGTITFEEMRTTKPDMSQYDTFSNPIKELLALDPNKDGKLTAEELLKLASSAFELADTDNNGLLSGEEAQVFVRAAQTRAGPVTRPAPDEIQPGFLNALPKGTEFHTIGVYEAENRNELGIGTVNVHVKRTNTPVVLLLTSYESVDWKLTLDTGVQLKGIILSGYHTSKVLNAPKDTLVLNTKRWRGYGLNDNGLDEFSKQLPYGKLHIASWQGNYRAKDYVIGNDFAHQPQKSYLWPKELKLPASTEIQVVEVQQGSGLSGGVKYTVSMDSDSGVTPRQTVTVDVADKTKPTLLVLSSPAAMVWRIKDVGTNIAGVILAGPNLQYLDTPLIAVPVVMWQDARAGLYNSIDYKKLATRVKETFNKEVTGYTGVDNASGLITVAAGTHFPSAEDTKRQTGLIDFPETSVFWSQSGEHSFDVPKDCNILHAMAWGGGGAGGSWSYGGNAGGGGGFSYDSFTYLHGKRITAIVGGGGKVGSHLSEKNDQRIDPAPGKGGYPDGGDGGTGYDATGGGGGGASRIILDKKAILIAGGGGGGCGHGDAKGLGGGNAVSAPNISGASGKNGVGGLPGILGSSRIDKSPLKAGDAGSENKGGVGGTGGRKGGGGGGGGYGGGGGGAPEFHFPGGGGGGGSLGKDVRPGTVDMAADARTRPGYPVGAARGIPGNKAQAGTAGYGGDPVQNGADGKIILWCDNQ